MWEWASVAVRVLGVVPVLGVGRHSCKSAFVVLKTVLALGRDGGFVGFVFLGAVGLRGSGGWV